MLVSKATQPLLCITAIAGKRSESQSEGANGSIFFYMAWVSITRRFKLTELLVWIETLIDRKKDEFINWKGGGLLEKWWLLNRIITVTQLLVFTCTHANSKSAGCPINCKCYFACRQLDWNKIQHLPAGIFSNLSQLKYLYVPIVVLFITTDQHAVPIISLSSLISSSLLCHCGSGRSFTNSLHR